MFKIIAKACQPFTYCIKHHREIMKNENNIIMACHKNYTSALLRLIMLYDRAMSQILHMLQYFQYFKPFYYTCINCINFLIRIICSFSN